MKQSKPDSYQAKKNYYDMPTTRLNKRTYRNPMERKEYQKKLDSEFFRGLTFDARKFDLGFTIEFFKTNCIRKDGCLNGNMTGSPRNFISKFGQETFDRIFSEFYTLKDGRKFTQYFYDLTHPKHYCVCGTPTMFINGVKGYLEFCSTQCSNQSSKKVDLIREKLLNPSEKAIETRGKCMEIRRRKILDQQTAIIESERLFKILLVEDDFRSNDTKYRLECRKCKNQFESSYVYRRCYKCYPKEFNCEEAIVECFRDFETHKNKKSVLPYKRLELDVYIPDLKLAIEFDGDFWHSFNDLELEKIGKHKDFQKLKMAEEIGLRLLRVREYEWNDPIRQEIWKSIFNVKQGKATRIPARKTSLEEISTQEAKVFLRENHLLGSCPSSIRYGLRHKEKLVAVMTLGRSRFNKNYDLELLRFCSLKNHVIIGGASKLMKMVESKFSGKKLISYANRRYSNGDLYEQIGFTKVGSSPPNYHYLKSKDKEISRNSAQKHKLPKLLNSFDPNKTETENMFSNGFRRIWDCGNLIYERQL